MSFIPHVLRAAAAIILACVVAAPLMGQDVAQPSANLPTYRAPLIALAQPLSGGVVAQDKPVIVFRFAAGEPEDPVDARSFAVSVDGEDRTQLFQMTMTEAWGPLASSAESIALGSHELVARICSARGACGTATAVVTVAPPGPGASAPAVKIHRKTKILDALFGALRTLLKP
jgi:hypothetical protein